MNRFLTIIVISIFYCTQLTSAAIAEESAASSKGVQLTLKPQISAIEVDCIKKKGYLRVAIINENYPPFIFKDKSGNFAGINAEIARKIAQALNIKAMFDQTATNQEELLELLAKGQADIGISRITLSSEFADRLKFSEGYAEVTRSILINSNMYAKMKKKSGETLRTILNREDARIGVIENSPYIDYLNKHAPKATLVYFKTWNEIVKSIRSKDILAGINDEISTQKVVKSDKQAPLNLLSIRIKENRRLYRIAVPWNSSNLLNWINSYISELKYFFDAGQLLKEYERSVASLNGENDER